MLFESLQAAISAGLDAERSTLYFDLVLASLSEAARKTLQAMDPAKYEYQSEFAKRYFSEERVEGRAEGRAEIVLERFAERVLSAKTIEEVLG